MRGSSRPIAGYTLVELLIAATVAALLATALAHIFSGVLDLTIAAATGRGAARAAESAVMLLREDVNAAERVIGASGGSLSLEDRGGNLVLYTLGGAGGDSLRRQVNAGAPQLVAWGVDSLAFDLMTLSRSWTGEQLLPDTVEALTRGFEPGDLDEHMDETYCNYMSRGEARLEDDDYAAIEWWSQTTGFFAFSRVMVRIQAKDHKPPEVDLLARLYRGNASGWPGTLLAQGTLSRWWIPTTKFDWVSIPLTTVTAGYVSESEDYWLILSAVRTGWASYAGHFEYERIEDCDNGEWPVNNATYWRSTSGGAYWSGGDSSGEGFHRIYGLTTVPRVTEVTETRTDTLGVTYALTLARGGESEHHAGFIALYSP